MEYPRQRELRAALRLLLDLDDAPDLDGFAERVIAGLRRVIPTDMAAYNELDLRRNETFVLVDPPDARFENVEDVLAAHMRDSPLVVHFERAPGDGPRMISDFITRRELHRRPIYAELFTKLQIEYQMVTNLPAGSRLIGVVLNRARRDFTERERALLALLRPHFVRAYENARSRAVLASLEAAVEEDGRAVVVLGRGGGIEHATPHARELLKALGTPNGDNGSLPPSVERWLHNGAGESLVAELDGRRIHARLLPPDRHIVVLEEEQPRNLSPDSLANLGLSRRETEVLALAATGVTNPEIATALAISRRTVKKHLERIYDKLGVHTRTAAVAVAFQTATRTERAA